MRGRDHPRGRGEGLEDGLLLLLRGLRGLRLHRQPQSHHSAQIHAPVQNCPQLVSGELPISHGSLSFLSQNSSMSYLSFFPFRPEEVQALISGKLALRYAGRQASTSRPDCPDSITAVCLYRAASTVLINSVLTSWRSLICFLLQTDALKCVAQASKNRSLADFEKVRIPFLVRQSSLLALPSFVKFSVELDVDFTQILLSMWRC